MDEQDFCSSCKQRKSCEEIYRRLGRAEGPSVIPRVVVAFLLPILVFTASLAAFEHILGTVLETKGQQTAVGSLLALLLTIGCILITQMIRRGPCKNNQRLELQNSRYED